MKSGFEIDEFVESSFPHDAIKPREITSATRLVTFRFRIFLTLALRGIALTTRQTRPKLPFHTVWSVLKYTPEVRTLRSEYVDGGGMTINIEKPQSITKSSPKIALIAILLALILAYPSIKSALNLGQGDAKCESWPSRQGEWYSVPPTLLAATADYPRMVDKSGVWAKSDFGLANGWIYAAKTPNGPLAYWAIAEEGMPEGAIYGPDGQIGDRFTPWYALNDEAFSLSLLFTRGVGSVGEADVNRMLTDKIRDSIAHCLGY